MKNGKFPREYQIRSFETNTTGNLKPTVILQYLQETAEFQLKVQDMDYVDMYMKLHKAYVVSRMSIQIHQQLHKYDHITIRTWTGEDRGANFPRSFDVYCGDQLAITAFSNWALIDTDKKTLVKRSEYDISNYAWGEKQELDIPTRFKIPRETEMSLAGIHHVSFNDTDINGHMNNAMYADVLYNYIPEPRSWDITSMNFHYRHEAPLGSDMEIHMSALLPPEDMDPKADKIIYFQTFTGEGRSNIEACFGLARK